MCSCDGMEAMTVIPDTSRPFNELVDEGVRKQFTISIPRTMKLEQPAEAHRLAKGGGVPGQDHSGAEKIG
jgi:hypothetical protein